MLKIRDDVDLKELEKFGFYKSGGIYQKDIIYEPRSLGMITDIYMSIYFRIEDRILRISTNFISVDTPKIDIIYDLIQASLVEKVD